MRHPHFHARLSHVAQASLLASFLALSHASPALAQTASVNDSTVYSLSISAQPLGAALNELARQAGLQLMFPPALVAGKTAPEVTGQMTAAQGLNRLLAGSGLVAVPEGRTVVIRAAATGAGAGATLSEVQVTASAVVLPGDPPPVFAGGQVARGTRTGLLGNTDIFDTPFSTKAYTAELIRNQGARSVFDIVANDPSIRTSLSATSPIDQSSIRGFITNSDAYLFDGLEGFIAYSSVPLQHYERLEILKGPAAGLVGASGYGSTVGGGYNLVPKRATDAPVRSVTFYAADKALFGTHVDLGQRFGVDHQLGARLNLTVEDGKAYDNADRRLITPQIALDYRGDKVRVVLDAGTVRRESSPIFDHWILAANAKVPAAPNPRVNPKPDWEYLDMRQTYGLLSGEWDFAPNWTAYARHGQFVEDPPERIYIDQTTINSAGQVTYSSASTLLWKQVNEVTDVGLRGTLQWGSTRHKLSLAMVRQRQQLQDLRSRSVPLATPVLANIYSYTPVPNPFANGVPNVVGVDSPALHLNSVAVADTVGLLDDRLLLTLALRQQTITQGAYDQSKPTPTAAALYKLGHGVSVYANYAEALSQGAVAPAGTANASEQLAPYVSRAHEFGVKWDRGSYGLTAAYFDIRKTTAYTDQNNVFAPAGQQQHKGVELETFGEVSRGVRLLGGVAWIDAKMTATAGGTYNGKTAIGVPDFTANLGAEVDVDSVPGLTFSGRFIHTGSAYADLANTQKIPTWRRFDAGVRYATRLGSTATTYRLGVNNLLDDRYWTIGGRNFIAVAPPRTWQVSASFDF